MSHPLSIQYQSLIDIFGAQGWVFERLDSREVLVTVFRTPSISLSLNAQVFASINALCIAAEVPIKVKGKRQILLLELLSYANKKITLGGLEYDIERSCLVFRLSNLFERNKYDPSIVVSIIQSAIAELDGILPYVEKITQAPHNELDMISPARILLNDSSPLF